MSLDKRLPFKNNECILKKLTLKSAVPEQSFGCISEFYTVCVSLFSFSFFCQKCWKGHGKNQSLSLEIKDSIVWLCTHTHTTHTHTLSSLSLFLSHTHTNTQAQTHTNKHTPSLSLTFSLSLALSLSRSLSFARTQTQFFILNLSIYSSEDCLLFVHLHH